MDLQYIKLRVKKMKLFKELYGAGILFFYYFKYPIIIGWPLLKFGLNYQDNIILDILWVYCIVLMIKDLIQLYHIFSKKP